jgi:RecA-family ATPase
MRASALMKSEEVYLPGIDYETDSKVITGCELLKNPLTEIQWLVEGLLPKTGVSILAGMSDLGKSAFLRQLGIHIVVNEEYFCGYKLNSTFKKTIYCASEDDAAATTSLLHKICDNRYKPEQLEGIRFVFDVPNNIEQTLRNELKKEPVDLIVIDCLMDLWEG